MIWRFPLRVQKAPDVEEERLEGLGQRREKEDGREVMWLKEAAQLGGRPWKLLGQTREWRARQLIAKVHEEEKRAR